jgi:hypothetical protein
LSVEDYQKHVTICPASGFNAYDALKLLVFDLVDFFKEIGGENSLLADRCDSQNLLLSAVSETISSS